MVGDAEEVEGVELHARTEVDDHVVSRERPKVPHELQFHPVRGTGHAGDELRAADEPQVRNGRFHDDVLK